jgi:hypothetical protein
VPSPMARRLPLSRLGTATRMARLLAMPMDNYPSVVSCSRAPVFHEEEVAKWQLRLTRVLHTRCDRGGRVSDLCRDAPPLDRYQFAGCAVNSFPWGREQGDVQVGKADSDRSLARLSRHPR